MDRIAITGGRGFLGWHTAVRLRAEHKTDPAALGREEFADANTLGESLHGIDTIIHLAGVNRAESDEAVENGNVAVAQTLADAISESSRPVHVVYGNSIQSQLDNPYGRGKARAAEILKETADRLGGSFVDVQMPNVFGEHGRPNYNSFIATFCREIANGREPQVTGDKRIPLLHAQAAAPCSSTRPCAGRATR